MDGESDDSERWEDFYGSSTELAPSLLSIYDALNTSLEAKNKNISEGNGKTHINVCVNGVLQTESKLHGSKNSYYSPKTVRRNLYQPPQTNKSSCRNRKCDALASTKHRNNIRLLSPNVQRIIAHSDVQHVDTIDIESLQHHPNDDESNSLATVSAQQLRKKSNPSNMSGYGHKSKHSLIPLSRGAEKLTMAGNELVPTFDSSSEYLDSLSCAQNQAYQSPCQHIENSDDEKTPTNTNKPFQFEHRERYGSKDGAVQYIDLLEMKKFAATTQLLSAISISSTHPKAQDQCVPLAKETPVPREISFDESTYREEKFEAVNTCLVNKSVIQSTSKSVKHLQSLAHPRSITKDDLRQQTSPLKATTLKSFSAIEEPPTGSTESLDRLTEMKSKFTSREPQKTSLLLPEVSKLKNRPLSSSSLCSTTSSSSSGSDNLNSKLSTSYLASVESLADHSESELAEQHANMSVLERSCLEIVDSERNYVEDLRQVITGYLSDWRERACLRVDELRILFSNIEEIYDFSLMLLKHLMQSSLDPLKIAKCFIEMRDSFSVYTKYCTSYPEAISLLTKLLQATHTNALLTSTQKMLQHTLPLGSYLLKPVQRILKYHLLLDNLRKHCDLREVFQAHEIMRQVARNIDQVKRRLEQQSRVKELSGILDGWLGPELTVLGELRLEGLLMDHSKPRKVFLFATMLIITKPKEDNRLQFKSYIHQNNLMLSEHLPGEPTSFYVIPYDEPRNQIKLTAKNRDQKRVWTQHIKDAMLEKFDNIPSRAKELVYKLGDEEDRSSEKSTRKWTINSTSVTPVYLERRNQYRRSELRNRFKLKRKSVADLSFMQSNSQREQTPEDESAKSAKSLARKNSLDDSMVPMLLRLATGARHKRPQTTTPPGNGLTLEADADHVNTDGEQFSCILQDQRNKSCDSSKLKERSKSVPRINVQSEEKKKDNPSSMEIKQYNHKTMPKRVATIKKQKNSCKRDTFKFYMDISEFDGTEETTVLKITESTENLSKHKDSEAKEVTESIDDLEKDSILAADEQSIKEPESKLAEKQKEDAQIVFDLLKDNKDFERIYKKSQKKRSIEVTPLRQEKKVKNPEKLPPPPPSSSPPLLETDFETKDHFEEHIYETLLRNVHVPYKFSPDFKRSKSLQHSTPREKRELSPRPESDYVLLKYSSDGTLQRIESSSGEYTTNENVMEAQCSTFEAQNTEPYEGKQCGQPQLLSTSESRQKVELGGETKDMIVSSTSLNSTKEKDSLNTDPKRKGLVKRLFVARNSTKISSLENISNAFLSRSSRRKSTDNSRSGGFGTRPPERRASDVSEMCRMALLHRQGSEAVGERMAYLDYADPRTLFNVATPLKHIQRDSFFSLTSSNDSVYGHNGRAVKCSNAELSTNFEYEDDVEDHLERDFRDSAIYSDDNEKRTDCDNERAKDSNQIATTSARESRKHTMPPKLPPKPPRLKALATQHSAAIACPPNISPTASRSWVLQQIENFSK